jgi:hypothetical protein
MDLWATRARRGAGWRAGRARNRSQSVKRGRTLMARPGFTSNAAYGRNSVSSRFEDASLFLRLPAAGVRRCHRPHTNSYAPRHSGLQDIWWQCFRRLRSPLGAFGMGREQPCARSPYHLRQAPIPQSERSLHSLRPRQDPRASKLLNLRRFANLLPHRIGKSGEDQTLE